MVVFWSLDFILNNIFGAFRGITISKEHLSGETFFITCICHLLIPFGRLHCVMWFFSSLEIGLQILGCINQNQNPGLRKSRACVDLSIADSGEVVVDKIQQKDDLDKGSFGSKINHPSALFDLKLVKEKIAKLGYGFNYSLFGNQQCLNFGHTWR